MVVKVMGMPPASQLTRNTRAQSTELRERALRTRRAAQDAVRQSRVIRALATWQRLLLRLTS
jgi:hypothetical protein